MDSLTGAPPKRSTAPIKVPLGNVRSRDATGTIKTVPLVWDSTRLLNGHVLMVGGSGTGKSYQLTRLLTGATATRGISAIVIDPHGTLVVPGEQLYKISQATPFGLNPLAVVDDPHFGGVRRRINAFINLMLRTATMGDRQKAAMTRLMLKMYHSYGFDADRPETWSLRVDPRNNPKYPKRQPTITDLKRYLFLKLEHMLLGMSQSAHGKFQEVVKAHRAMQRARKAGDEEKLDQLKAQAVDAYREGLDRITTGDELNDLIEWESVESVKGLYDRIERLEASGIFKGDQPQAGPGAILRYDISSLLRPEQQAFVECLLEMEFFGAKMAGETTGPNRLIAIDESSIFLDNDPDHIIAVIHREARKFGLALILATQAVDEFPQPALTSSSTKLILGVDPSVQKRTETKLALDPGRLRCIQPKVTMLAQMRRDGDNRSHLFYEVTF